jgi:hypothetical protein
MTSFAMLERPGRGGRMQFEEREERKVPLRENFDTHLHLWFHGGTQVSSPGCDGLPSA